jgi:nucleoside-diphosphate-sugar epimerase
MAGRVLVTGAAGLVGGAVLDLLAERGIPATALVLQPPQPQGPPENHETPGRAGAQARVVAAGPASADEPPDQAGAATGAAHGHGLRADRVVVGDARDGQVVDEALKDVDAVIHLAAIPHPDADPAELVFGLNTLATFTVLDRAARAGVTKASIASSYAICGLPFARKPLRMPYLPIDTALPLQITDPYALSKQVDEATADMIHRRYGTSVVALRLPFVGTAEDRLAAMAAWHAEDPSHGAPDVWSYLDARDAARALLAGLTPAKSGSHVVYVAAPETLAPQPTEWLLDTFHPGVPRPRFSGRTVAIDLEPARELLGFTAEHLFGVR